MTTTPEVTLSALEEGLNAQADAILEAKLEKLVKEFREGFAAMLRGPFGRGPNLAMMDSEFFRDIDRGLSWLIYCSSPMHFSAPSHNDDDAFESAQAAYDELQAVVRRHHTAEFLQRASVAEALGVEPKAGGSDGDQR